MFSAKSKKTLMFVLSLILVLGGLGYILYLNLIFPSLVPYYGSGERFTLVESEYFATELPLLANTRLHFDLQTNDTIKLYVDNVFVCDCKSYELVVEPNEQILVSLTSESPVSGLFSAWQEIPFWNQIFGLIVVAVGLLALVLVVITNR